MSTDTPTRLSDLTDESLLRSIALLRKLKGGESSSTSVAQAATVLACLPPMDTPTPTEFRQRLMIRTSTGMATLHDALDDWQRRDYEAIDPAWMRIAGLSDETCKMAAYLERPKGHSKTGDIAVMVLWLLFASKLPIVGVVAASDWEQAGYMREGAERLILANPWISERVEIQKNKIFNAETKSHVTIISSDVASSHGETPDLVICDEVVHWKKRELWDSLVAAVPKKPLCLMVVITHAGTGKGTSWQWDIRESCRLDPDWYFSRLDGPCASWITEESLRKARGKMLAREFQRVWLNIWTSGSGDALPLEDVEACCTLPGPISRADPGWLYLMGMDLAIHRDHAAIVVLGLDPEAGRYRMPYVRSWNPQDYGGTIRLGDVQREVKRCAVAYDVRRLYYDPQEAGLMVEQLREFGLDCERVKFGDPTNLNLMALRLILTFRDRLIDLYHDEGLIRDLGRIEIVERPTLGFKIQAVSDETGHCDRAIALAIVLAAAHDWMRELRADLESPRGPERVRA